jgi:hypothetical protein
MLRLVLILVGIAAMVAFYFFIHWLVTGISEQFGAGVFVGAFLIATLTWVAWKADPRSFYSIEDRKIFATLTNDRVELSKIAKHEARAHRKFSDMYSRPVRIILGTMGVLFLCTMAMVAYASLMLGK